MTDFAAAERQQFLAQPFPIKRTVFLAGIFAGVLVASFLSGYMAQMTETRERARLAKEVRSCPGDTVVLESGARICKAGIFRVVPRRNA